LFAILVRQRELRRFFTDPRRLSRKRHLSQNIKNLVGKKRKEKNAEDSEDGTENFAAINLRSPESSEKTDEQQRRADSEERKIDPRKIARARKLDEKKIRS